MKRKLIRQGDREHGSFTITLPAAWIKQYGLKAGDELDIDENGSTIVLNAKKGPVSQKVVHIDARGLTITQLRRNIAEAYRMGAETIEVEYENVMLVHSRTQRKVSMKEEIENLVTTELFGMEIEKSSPSLFIIKQFSEGLEEEFDAAFRKIFFRLQDQVEQALEALRTMKTDQLKDVWLYDRGVNKFCNFCMRILNKKGHKDAKIGNELYAALVQLELVGDQIYMIPMILAKTGAKKVGKDVVVLLNDLKKAVDSCNQFFIQGKEEDYMKIIRLRERFYEIEKRSFNGNGLDSASIAKIGFAYELLINLRDVAVGIKKRPT